MRQAQPAPGPSVDSAEIERFSRLSASWWNERGPFAPLHRLNPARLKLIRDHAARHFERDPRSLTPLAGLDVVDVGCGGGLIAEPLARMGVARAVGYSAYRLREALRRIEEQRDDPDFDQHLDRLSEGLAA